MKNKIIVAAIAMYSSLDSSRSMSSPPAGSRHRLRRLH